MSRFASLIFGIILGFVAAHCVNQTPRGRHFFDQVGRGAQEFSDAVIAGYRGTERPASEEPNN